MSSQSRKNGVVQQKAPRTAPAPYRPQPTPRVLQLKRATPAVYKPQPQQHVLQRKTAQVNTPIQRKQANVTLPMRPARSIPGKVVQRSLSSCWSGFTSLFSSCFGSSNAGYQGVELEDLDSRLPPWGNAVSLGYHKTAHWNQIQSSGEFRPGGGRLGNGIYIVKSDYAWLAGYSALNVLLEVGYVGDTSQWKTLVLDKISDWDERSEEYEGNYDVVKTKHDVGVQNQICYKMDGPAHINPANFRVRRVEA